MMPAPTTDVLAVARRTAELVEQLAVQTTSPDDLLGPSLLAILRGARYASTGTIGTRRGTSTASPLNLD